MRNDPTGCAWWNPFSWDWGAIGRTVGGTAIAIAGLAIVIATARLALKPFASFIPQFGISGRLSI